MLGIITRLRTLRLWMLFFSLPYGMLWVYGSDSGHVHGSGGWITVALHSLLMLLHLASADLRQVGQGLMPRLRVARTLATPDPDVLSSTRARLAMLTLALILVHFFVEPRVALMALLALALILWTSAVGDPRSRRWRHRFAEAIWPVALLIVPMALLASPGVEALESAREAGDRPRVDELEARVMVDGAIIATMLGALLLCAFVILCFIRDRVQDLGAGIRTAATSLGRGGATGALFTVLFAAIVLANWASIAGHWEWHVPAVLAIGATVTAWLLGGRQDRHATIFLFTTHIALAILLVAIVG